MKKMMNMTNRLMLLIATILYSLPAMAQEEATKLDVNVTKTTETTTWYASPWVWVIGAAIFILLFAAILRGGGSRTDA